MDPNPSSLCGLLAEGPASEQCQSRGGIFPGHGIGEAGGCEGARNIYGSGNVTTQVQLQAQGTSADCELRLAYPARLTVSLSLSFPPFWLF